METERKALRINDLDDRSYALHFSLARDIRYDRHRQAFFERFGAGCAIVQLFAGSAAASLLLDAVPNAVGAIGGALVALLAMVQLAVRPDRKAVEHKLRAVRLGELHRRLSPPHNLSDEEYVEIDSARQALLADAPPAKALLVRQCHYETLSAFGGRPEQIATFAWWARLTAHWFSWRAYMRRASLPQQYPVLP